MSTNQAGAESSQPTLTVDLDQTTLQLTRLPRSAILQQQ
jgi:hypothetical protein